MGTSYEEMTQMTTLINDILPGPLTNAVHLTCEKTEIYLPNLIFVRILQHSLEL